MPIRKVEDDARVSTSMCLTMSDTIEPEQCGRHYVESGDAQPESGFPMLAVLAGAGTAAGLVQLERVADGTTKGTAMRDRHADYEE
jgi:hypothetical protein